MSGICSAHRDYDPHCRLCVIWTRSAYKVLTHDYGSPIQCGAPIFDGSLPFELPIVDVDDSSRQCGAGWNACATGADTLRIAGLWPDGWPARLYRVETDAPVIERGDKLRSSTWTIVEQIDVEPHVRELSAAFGEHADAMHESQMAWYHALGRPLRNDRAVEDGLRAALDARGLDWSLQRFNSARDARRAFDACGIRTACAARDTWYDWMSWEAWDHACIGWPWNDASWNESSSLSSFDANASLTLQYAALMGWIKHDPVRLTIGIRDAYQDGLALCIPVASGVLGWAMIS